MRMKWLGTIAAVAAGAGSALSQTPPPPMPIGPAGGAEMGAPPMMGGPGMGAPGMGGVQPVPYPGVGMGGPPGMMGMGMGGNPGFMGSGLDRLPQDGPGYPGGLHGQPSYQLPQAVSNLNSGYNRAIAARSWLDLEYLLWFSKSQPTQYPYVVSSAPIADGILGATSTRIASGSRDFGYNGSSGFRGTLGFFCDDSLRNGLYVSGFVLAQQNAGDHFASDATGQPLYARPFINAATGQNDRLLVSYPTRYAGAIDVSTSTQLYGVEGGGWTNLFRSCPEDGCLVSLNFLTAFRYLQLSEDLTISQTTSVLPGSSTTFDGKLYNFPATVGVTDDFQVRNRFYGGQVGLQGEVRYNRLFVSGTAKVALGVMNEQVDVNGFSTINGTGTGADSTVGGGLYANANNINRYRTDRFAVIPEFGVNLGYTLRSWLTVTAGYNYLYVSRVARPANQYTPVVDPGVIPTAAAYGTGGAGFSGYPPVAQSTYWMQGVSFGLALRY